MERFNDENYVSIFTLMTTLGIEDRGSTTHKAVLENFLLTQQIHNIPYINFEHKTLLSDGYKELFAFDKNQIIRFQNEYVSISSLYTLLGKRFTQNLMNKNPLLNVIKFQQTVASGMFISKYELESIPLYKSKLFELNATESDVVLIPLEVIRKQLGIGKDAFNTCLSEFEIDIIKIKKTFHVRNKEAEFLINKQMESYSLLETHYLGSEVKALLKRTFLKEEIESFGFTRVPCPCLLPTKIPTDKNGFLWLKSDVDRYLSKREVRDINQIFLSTPFETFELRVNTLFPDIFKLRNSQKLWFNFVDNFFLKSSASDTTISKRIGNFIEITQTLFQLLHEEVYLLSSNQLNLLFFNDIVPVSHQFHIFNFLKYVIDLFKKENHSLNFNLSSLKNPYRTYKAVNPFDESCYTIDEYQSLFEYACDVNLHQAAAASDAKNHIFKLAHTNYDSVWLYVLIHLTNNWRHTTVMEQLPRIDLSRIRARDLDWFIDNELNDEECKDIVYQVGRHVIDIRKTGAEGIFKAPERLHKPIATALCICELRLRALLNDKGYLVCLPSDKTVNSPHSSAFFNHFELESFVFENRKMNRTLTTFIWSIVRHFSDNADSALKASQHTRSHLEQSSTNIYIKLTQKQLDELTEQLFSRESFGFVYKMFSDIVFGKSENKMVETQRIQGLQEKFGSIFKVEATSGFINKLIQNEQEIQNFISSMSREQISEYYHALLLNQLPSKEKHFQCIKKECINNEINCSDCPFSIPNIYSLSSLMDTYKRTIEAVTSFDSMPVGEKMRHANQLFKLMKTVSEARDAFGDDTVYSFLSGGRDEIKNLTSLLPPKDEVEKYIFDKGDE